MRQHIPKLFAAPSDAYANWYTALANSLGAWTRVSIDELGEHDQESSSGTFPKRAMNVGALTSPEPASSIII